MRSRIRRRALFGVLQDVSVDISGDIKELYGQNQFAEAVARGKAKISCKAKFGRINGRCSTSVLRPDRQLGDPGGLL
jgi:hypothetical protein